MISPVQKLKSAWKLYGFGTFNILMNRLFGGILRFQSFILYTKDLAGIHSVRHIKDPAVTIHKVENDEDTLFEKFRLKYTADEFVSRLKLRGETCYVALKNNEVVGYAWVTFDELYIDAINRLFTMKEDELFIYSCFVEKKNRGSGIYPGILNRILYDFQQLKTYNRAFIGVNAENMGSIHGIEKAGFQFYHKIRYRKFLNREKWKIPEGRLISDW